MGRGEILVVDDEANARLALAELINGEGYGVTVAANGAEAMLRLQEREPDIVLTDLKMPVMGGIELLRRLRAQNRDATVIVMTAFGAVDTAVAAMKEGAADYLRKPFSLDELVLVLDREMRRRALRREADQAKMRLIVANRDLEAFAARVAHDLRAPLTPIALLATTLKHHSVDPKIVRTADRIAASAQRADEMIGSLLRFSRTGCRESGATAAPAAVIRQSLDDFASRIAEAAVVVETDLSEAAVVACGASLFRQVVDNLVGNALKHLEGRDRRRLFVRLSDVGAHVELEVQDSGPGIPGAALEKIFDLFYRVPGDKAPGHGIGLATVRRIVEAQGGQVLVRSVVGEGATFLARFPAAAVAPRSLA